jgi:branched-chain amino acid transport system ATP-binding protein
MLLELKNVEAGYGEKSVLFNVSLNMDEGKMVAMVGPNGAGKTTTLQTIVGIIHPTHGDIIFDNMNTSQMRTYEVIRHGISLVPQGGKVFGALSVSENLEMGGYKLKSFTELKEALNQVFDLFPVLKDRIDQRAGTLSGGEQQMLAIGRGLMSGPKLMLLDEPSMGLAPKVLDELMMAIVQVKENTNTSILIVEQNVKEILKVADEVYGMKLGKIVFHETTPEKLLQDDKLIKAYLA